ncbi:MAG: hypothetical protein IJ200_02570 [Prevotella sp.]|nr:hypothetical protein [Prevotella sp.]
MYNNKLTNKRRGRPWQWMLLLALFAWLLPQEVAAGDWFVERTYQYQVMLNGANTIRIKAPVYDEDAADHWVSNANLNVTWTDDSGNTQTKSLLNWGFNYKREGSHDNSDSTLPVFFKTSVGGSIDITQGNSSNHFTLKQEDGEQTTTVYENTDGETYSFSAVWRIPYDMLGKSLKLEWAVTLDHTAGTDYTLKDLSSTTIDVPSAQAVMTPQLTAATMSYSKEGMLEIPWFMATDKMTAARYEYTDHLGKLHKVDLQPKATSDVIYLDATVPHHDFRIVVSYKDNNDYEIQNISSEVQDLPVIHAPQGLTLRPLGGIDSKMELKWHLMHRGTNDMSVADHFYIQRSLTGLEKDFEEIGMEPYMEGVDDSTYTFVDSTLVQAIAEAHLVNGGTLPNVTYRVRRAMTENWGWEKNSCAKQASCSLDNLHLLRIKDYTAQWVDSLAFTARVSWNYADEPGAVWDDRARMVVQVAMKNRDGQPVDTMRYELNQTDREQRYKVVTLSRSCVSFDVDVLVERGESALNYLKDVTKYFFPIRTTDDWTDFKNKVQAAGGNSDVNARLYADIEINKDQIVGWENGYAYRGIFDGGGHTLTLNFADTGQEFIGPFRYVGNATIRNLHTAGTINTSIRYAAGLIGWTMEGAKVIIDNCRSSVTLKSSVNGEALLGGFIARQSAANVIIRNSKFDGSFEGANAANNRGFVAWVARGSSLVIDNCLFAPDQITTKLDGCQTWVGLDTQDVNYTNTNSYATREYSSSYIVINKDEDWNTFKAMVEAAKGNYDVNVSLNADISITNPVGWDGAYPYRGTFEGNGHTLTANLNDNGAGVQFYAPFRYAKTATFRNLHVTGSVSGALHTAGIVGGVRDAANSTLRFENVRVSANVTTSDTHVGGFVGHANNSTVYITNCLFDGNLKSTSSSYDNTYGGAFTGWGDGSWGFECNYENGSYSGILHTGMCYRGFSSPWGGSATSYSAHNWGEMASAANRNLTDQSKAVTLLGSQWHLVNGKAVPVMEATTSASAYTADELLENLGNSWTQDGSAVVPATTTLTYHEYVTSFPKPTLPNFYHASNGKIDPELVTQTRQSSVLLSWNTDGNPIDYFTVMRRTQGKGDDAWTEVATDLTGLSYEDTSVSPLLTYEYKVVAVNQCEGRDSTETKVVVGESKHTGRVEGYVRFNDGTGVAGIRVNATYDGKVVKYDTTDESGHYDIDELSYQGKANVEYKIAVVNEDALEFEAGVSTYSITFNANSNDETVHEFIITNGKRFSGFVMYDGTSIPVKGVNFSVNGQRVHNATGDLVETDYDGSFSFRVLQGDNTIQAVMDKHVFTNDGWYKSSEKQNITSDIAGIYFYDATKVKLVGRIVGGNDQGQKPLDNNLSKNNLGDSLTMVLTLEGDNTSWLVYDNQHPNRSVREEVVRHQRHGDRHYTTVRTERKRMTVWPDVKTGEYTLKLPPVRWKVQQVYCSGYATLFQEGQVSEVIDLTNALDTLTMTYDGTYKDVDTMSVYKPTLKYNAIYNRIYRAPVEVTYKQIGYDTFDYFGDKNYMASNLAGDQRTVPLAYLDPIDSVTVHYTFSFPVFSLERKYGIKLQVAERYQYNNDPRSGAPDLVRLKGGTAYMQNGMKAGATKEPQELDSLGQTVFTVQADQVTRMLTGLGALKTVSFTVERDGTTYEAEPLRGYVLNMFPLGEGKDVLADGQPILMDILRDPPGGYSSATLARGATISNSYMMNLSLSAGPIISVTGGQQSSTYFGTVATAAGNGSTAGYLNSSDNSTTSLTDLVFNMVGNKAYTYTMVLNNAVSTSSDPSMVGADADLYIGTVQNVTVTPMSTIRALTDSMYNEIKSQLSIGQSNTEGILAQYAQYGDLVEIAEGYSPDKDGKLQKFHLVRDLSLGYGPKLQSNFIYSQKQIMTQIIPAKAKEILNLMFIGSKADAQTLANKTKKPVYLSLRNEDDEWFGTANTKIIPGHAYNTEIEVAEDGINYLVVLPDGKKESDFTDEVLEKCMIIYAWAKMITQNEHEKLSANDLVNNYDVAGAAGVNYSETYDAGFSETTMQYFPFGVQPDYFETAAASGSWMAAVSLASKFVAVWVASLTKKLSMNPSIKTNKNDWINENAANKASSTIEFGGMLLKWSILPVVSMQTMGTRGEGKSYNRTESFTLACDPQSHLNVDVYRVKPANTEPNKSHDLTNIFTNGNFYDMSGIVLDRLSGKLSGNQIQVEGPRSFVYRTRGGSTQNPWEDQRVTQFYNEGSELDARTLKIVNPKITLDKQSVSGVSIDDAAKFTIILSNESEKPEATEGLTVLQLFSLDQANPQGAKISVNGQTLTTGGMSVSVVPGLPTVLTMEVRAGQGFDYEGLTIGVMSPTDAVNTKELVSFDVHFLHEAGGVNIQTPGDKWVLNTNAQQNAKRGWYIPVVINGFDRHQHNFDHIELQYKESQRGDDAWTNVCSFYASDSLMALANGVRKLIPENGNIITEFYGEGWVIERTYDLRAVLCCRNGSDFLTTPSRIISGIKDTRRPQLFGTPEPKSGLLTAGDDIVFNFSEDIEYNYLSAITNFEVKGETNNDDVTETVSVQFNGTTASVESEAKRNFSGKNLTIDLMVKPTETGRDMPLFSHGTNGQKLQLWLTSDFKLKAIVNDEEFVSDSVIGRNAFRQVAVSINQQDSTLTFFKGGVEIGRKKMNGLYTGSGPLIFGRTNEQDRSKSTFYEGRMMEARLWYAAMDGGLIGSTYGGHHLTGYEKDLVDYYPMNEGSGDYVTDYTQGANAKLMNAAWAIPQGVSLKVEKADKGVLLDKNAMNRTAEQDYTLMFWFKTDTEGRGTLLSNGRGLRADNGAVNQFHIGFEADKLVYRSNGFAQEVPGNWSDGKWHNYAMTVNRGRSVANIYMDKELVTTFEADTLGGISGGYPLIGASRYDIINEKDTLLNQDGLTPLKGNVDELMFFAQALPQQLISTYASKSPNGDEAGLLTYLSFDRQERQKDNSIELVPYVYSKKLYLDDQGKPRYELDPETKKPTDTLVRDYVFVDDEDEILARLDRKDAAPVVPYEEVTNLKFAFIGRGNQVLVELDEPNAKLNHRNIYVTLRDIEDLNGNTMASPQTACYYVTNSSLQWLVNRLDATIKYGSGEECELPFYNNGAQSHTYTVENCPRWLTLDKYSGVIAPQTLDYVMATVSKDLNVGTYNEIIYLTDEEGITEPFYLNLTVEGEQPEWADHVNSEFLANSMNISGQVYLYDELDSDPRDIVGVFDNENQCHGFANITHDVQSTETGLYLTVYDSQASGRELKFRLWQYSTGREIVLTPAVGGELQSPTITFQKDAMLGTNQPVRFDGGEDFVQNFKLQKGWNWVSFNLKSKQLSDVNKLLGSMRWSDGDILTELNSKLTMSYEAAQKQWIATGNTDGVTISPQKSYAIKVQKDCTLPISGTVVKELDDRTIEVKKGWNAIGYTPMTNLTVETALSDYYDQAEQGDVIKSHTEFAYFTKSGNTGRWRGSLQYMKPGEGYMMLRKGEAETSFTYPYYDMSSNFREDWNTSITRAAAPVMSPSTMSVSATVKGFDVEDGDVLIAYSNGDAVGMATVLSGSLADGQSVAMQSAAESQEPLYLSIAGDAKQGIWFAIERDGEIVAATGEVMTFQTNAVIGSPDDPTAINFVRADYADGQWYTISGMKLQKRPTQSGVYIFNGKKVVVR